MPPSTVENALHIVFVCPDAGPLFDTREQGDIGGMERRMWLFATALAQKYDDCRVSAMVCSRRGRRVDDSGMVRLIPLKEFRAGWLQRMADETYEAVQVRPRPPFIKVDTKAGGWNRSLPWKLLCRGVWVPWSLATFKRARSQPHARLEFARLRADLLITFGANIYSANAIASAKRFGFTSVLATASDSDYHIVVGSGYPSDVKHRAAAARFCLERADYIIGQTEKQRELLRDGPFRRDCLVIRNPVLVPHSLDKLHQSARERILWVGRADHHHKRPRLLLEIARRLPRLKFQMVMNRTDSNLYSQIVAEAPGNVAISDGLRPDEMAGCIGRSAMLASTAARDQEGFPNIFLEAAVQGTAVVSLEADPDAALSTKGLGVCCNGDLEKMADVIDRLSRDERERECIAQRALEYVEANHNLDAQVAELHDFLLSIGPRKGERAAIECSGKAAI
ncbi:MAG TPA: glycosyltransferase family 4 protein [Pirellulales bacterium]|nr:glycosyltransferase family 4 protein [Pirellulales bacterium]